MNPTDLKPEQLDRLKARVSRHLRYYNRLTERMTRLGFVPGDPLYGPAMRTRNVLQDLFVAAHYASCKSGVAMTKDDPAGE